MKFVTLCLVLVVAAFGGDRGERNPVLQALDVGGMLRGDGFADGVCICGGKP